MFLPTAIAAIFAVLWRALRPSGGACLLLGVGLLMAQGSASAAQAKLQLHSAANAGAVVQTPEVRAELVAFAPDGIGRGRPLALGLLLQHQPGWHTYWENPGDSGLPTELHWTLPVGLSAGPVLWPTPRKIYVGNLANFGYEGVLLLPVAVSVEPKFQPVQGASEITVGLKASWLVCQKECIPQEGEFALRLPLQGSSALHADLFEAARAGQAQPIRAKLSAEMDGDSLVLRAEGLPAQWQGKAINAFTPAVNVFAASSTPSDTDPVEISAPIGGVANTAPKAGTQAWQGNAWSARLPLSPQRSTSPARIGLLFALGDRSFQGSADVKGEWPVAPTPNPSQPQQSDNGLQAGAVDAALAPLPSPTTSPAHPGLWWAIGAAFIGGLILNLMPCVFPVLAIKVLGFATQPGNRRVAPGVLGLAYTAGVVASMVALGGGLLALRAGGEQLGWGFQLQSPAVVASLAVLFTLIALNLLGLLEWGTLVPGTLAGLQLRHPAADAALSGVLAVAVASPCTAPFMGASLGLALTLPAWQAMGIFVALALGLALPFAVASSIPQVASWLPRPGAWMVHLRHFMAFPMAATVLWLLWVLGHMGGLDAAVSLAVLLWCLALTIWSLSLPGRSRWVFGSLALLLSLATLQMVGHKVLQVQAPSAAPGDGDPAQPLAGLGQWQPWSAQRVTAELGNGHPVFVDFTAAWCITCQYNKQTTLSDAKVLQDFAAKQVTLLRADWTRRDPSITQALADLGRSGVPVYVLYQSGQPPLVFSEILSPSDLRTALRAL
jgi:thiol:disulfide interchange protein DsbD